MTVEELKELLKKANLTKKEFAGVSNISYGTVGNWNNKDRPVPPWVKSWLENYIKAKDIDKVAETMKPYIKY